jgi:hypothetical protein
VSRQCRRTQPFHSSRDGNFSYSAQATRLKTPRTQGNPVPMQVKECLISDLPSALQSLLCS